MQDTAPLPLICLLGPTAVGKTAFAFALAEHFPVHLISVDAAQIYRGMNIGTAKPDAATLARYPHALIDILEPEEVYSAAQFCRDAQTQIALAHQQGKIPVLVGGTMLYFLALFEGLADLPASTADSRAAIEAQFAADNGKTLYADLEQRDPITAAQISPNDRQRLIRFSELMLLTGQTPQQLFAAQEKLAPAWQTLAIGFNCERSLLHERIALRLQDMLAQGFIEEVAALRARPQLTSESVSMRSVGYRQFWAHLAGECSQAQALEAAIIATRQLAKRQITWMNNRPQAAIPLQIHNPLQSGCTAALLKQVEAFLSQ